MRNFRLFGALALCAVMMPSLTSCSDDDDDKGGDGTGGVLEIEGERLSYISGTYGTYTLDYDSKGRVSNVSNGYGDLDINYSKGTITIAQNGSDDTPEKYKVKFNDRGYITELANSWNETYTEDGDKYQVKGSGTVKFSYNGSGCLTTVSSSMSETEKDLGTGESERFSESYTTKLTWTNGNLVKAVCKGTENDGGDKDSYSETFDIDYSTTANVYLQNPVAITEIVNDDTEWDVLAAAGLFGKGPKMLPRCVSETDDDGYSNTSNVSYTLNSVGSISTERIGYTTYNYNYEDVDSRAADFSEAKPFASGRRFFVKGSRRR